MYSEKTGGLYAVIILGAVPYHGETLANDLLHDGERTTQVFHISVAVGRCQGQFTRSDVDSISDGSDILTGGKSDTHGIERESLSLSDGADSGIVDTRENDDIVTGGEVVV